MSGEKEKEQPAYGWLRQIAKQFAIFLS